MGILGTIDLSLALAAVVAAIGGWVGWVMVEDARLRRNYRLPPLVPGLPFVGNTFQMPKVDQGPYLQKLAAEYGEM